MDFKVPYRLASLILVASLLALSATWLGFRMGSEGGVTSDSPRQSTVKPSITHSSVPATAIPAFPPLYWQQPAPESQVTFQQRLKRASSGPDSVAWIDAKKLIHPGNYHKGDLVSFPLGEGRTFSGSVELVKTESRPIVSGILSEGTPGSFVLSDTPGKGISGQLMLPHEKLVYEFTQEADRIKVEKRPLNEVICEGILKEPEMTSSASVAKGPAAIVTPPSLDSLPSAAGVIYLDFDGETVTDPHWNGGRTIFAAPAVFGSGSEITVAQMTDVWRHVAEDFKPFNVSVTTIRSRYTNAPVGNRMRCIITPTTTAAPGSGGVAYYKSYRAGYFSDFEDDIPCWCFNDNDVNIMSMTISHEIGHTLNLRHDGTSTLTYYGGHMTTGQSWGPIMGAPFSREVIHWSRKTYPDANNDEDDLLIIQGVLEEANGVNNAYLPDEAGATLATAKPLDFLPTIDQHGIISTAADVDYFRLDTPGGPLAVDVEMPMGANLDIRMSLLSSTGATIATAPVLATAFGATINRTLTPGTYYLAVSSGYREDGSGYSGYPAYSSIGGYRLSGSYVPLPQIPLILSDLPASTTILEGKTLTLKPTVLSITTASYVWKKDGQPIPSKTASSLTFRAILPSDAGTYSVEVTNVAGMVESAAAEVIVHYKPVFTTPASLTNQTISAGASLTLSAPTVGTAPVTYQWQKNKVNITDNPSATTAALDLPNIDWFDAGVYTCIASNQIGTTTSPTSAKLTVTSAPVFTTNLPLTKAVAVGSTFTLSSSTVGTGTASYQWFKGSTPLLGATKASLTLKSASEEVHEGDPYTVRATNTQGVTNSQSVAIDVQIPPSVATPSQTAFNSEAGATFALGVTASGTPDLHYQWYLNGNPVASVDQPILDLSPLHWSHTGSYKCVISNDVGAVTSKNFTVKLTSPAVILVDPQSTKIATGGTGTLKVMAGGTPTLSYQWFKGSTLIIGATKSILTLSKANESTEGSYHVEVSNGLSVSPAVSAVAQVEVEYAPSIQAHPLSRFVPVGGQVDLTVVPTTFSAPVLRYQWYKGKVPLPGETQATLTFLDATTSINGSYTAVVTNDVGSVTSKAATLTVQIAPEFSSEPVDREHYEWDTVTFQALAIGTGPLTYSWHHNNGPAIKGANKPILTLPKVRAISAGEYTCVVSNKVGTVTSRPALLILNAVPEPIFDTISPSTAAVGDRFRITGENLNWTTSVKIGTTACSFVKVGPTELLCTVPAGARSGAVTVTTYGGTLVLPTSFTVKSAAPNDMFADAKLLFGSSVVAKGNNTGSTAEYGEPYTTSEKSVWFRWRCPSSGTYTVYTGDTWFGHECNAYTGSSLFNLSWLGWSYNYTTSGGIYVNKWQYDITAFKGQDIYIQFEGISYREWDPPTGTISFTIKRATSFSLAADTSAAEKSDATHSLVLLRNGVEDSATAKATAPSTTPAATKVTLSASFHSQATVTAPFSLSAYTRADHPLLSLIIDPNSRSIWHQTQGSTAIDTQQVYQPGACYDVEITADFTTRRWGAMLNGAWILEDAAIPAGYTLSDLSDLSLVSLPSASSQSEGASLTLESASASAEASH